MEINNKELGRIIKERRKELGLTQEELAEKTGTSQPYISELEKGKKDNPTVATLTKLAEVLKINLEELSLAIANRKERMKLIVNSNARYSKETEELIESLEEPDIRKIARAGQKMTPEQRKKWIEMGKILFEEVFKEKEEEGEENKDE